MSFLLKMQRLGLLSALAASLAATLIFLPGGGAARPLDFYKLSLQWPPAVCTSPIMGFTCMMPFLREFTIHGLWPQYNPDGDVPPYNPTDPCTNQKPTDPDAAMSELLVSETLTKEWPNLRNYTSMKIDEVLWREQWIAHGMCSDWPTEPNKYFWKGLELNSNLFTIAGKKTLLSVLEDAGFQPRAGATYQAGAMSTAVTKAFGKSPQIASNVAFDKVKQLEEIHFCYERITDLKGAILLLLRDCPTLFYGDICTSEDQIRFPPVPVL